MYSFVLAVCFFTFVAAQYGPAPAPSSSASSPSTSSSATSPATTAAAAAASAPANTPGHMNVDVAFSGTFTFHPANITAPNGTLVTFFFPPAVNGLTHSVSQSSFANPCTYLTASGSSPAGFDSGLTAGAQFAINITDDTIPIWYHCKQVGHCGLGMVGSINAPATGNTFDAFQAAAKAIGGNEKTEPDNGPVTGGVGAVATAPPTSGTSSGSSRSTSTSTSTSTKSSSAGDKLTASAALAFIAGAFSIILS